MDSRKIEHYRVMMKAYGTLIVELADSDEEIIKIITGENSGGLLGALREQIKNYPLYD